MDSMDWEPEIPGQFHTPIRVRRKRASAEADLTGTAIDAPLPVLIPTSQSGQSENKFLGIIGGILSVTFRIVHQLYSSTIQGVSVTRRKALARTESGHVVEIRSTTADGAESIKRRAVDSGRSTLITPTAQQIVRNKRLSLHQKPSRTPLRSTGRLRLTNRPGNQTSQLSRPYVHRVHMMAPQDESTSHISTSSQPLPQLRSQLETPVPEISPSQYPQQLNSPHETSVPEILPSSYETQQLSNLQEIANAEPQILSFLSAQRMSSTETSEQSQQVMSREETAVENHPPLPARAPQSYIDRKAKGAAIEAKWTPKPLYERYVRNMEDPITSSHSSVANEPIHATASDITILQEPLSREADPPQSVQEVRRSEGGHRDTAGDLGSYREMPGKGNGTGILRRKRSTKFAALAESCDMFPYAEIAASDARRARIAINPLNGQPQEHKKRFFIQSIVGEWAPSSPLSEELTQKIKMMSDLDANLEALETEELWLPRLSTVIKEDSPNSDRGAKPGKNLTCDSESEAVSLSEIVMTGLSEMSLPSQSLGTSLPAYSEFITPGKNTTNDTETDSMSIHQDADTTEGDATLVIPILAPLPSESRKGIFRNVVDQRPAHNSPTNQVAASPPVIGSPFVRFKEFVKTSINWMVSNQPSNLPPSNAGTAPAQEAVDNPVEMSDASTISRESQSFTNQLSRSSKTDVSQKAARRAHKLAHPYDPPGDNILDYDQEATENSTENSRAEATIAYNHASGDLRKSVLSIDDHILPQSEQGLGLELAIAELEISGSAKKKLDHKRRERDAAKAAKRAAEEAAAAKAMAEAAEAERRARSNRRMPKQKLVKPLSKAWEAKINEALDKGDHVALTTTVTGTELRRRDFLTVLGEREWLNDEIINAYLEWVVEYANTKAGRSGRNAIPKVVAHNSFFYKNLATQGPRSVSRWMKRKKAEGRKLLEVETVLIPVNNANHWTILVVSPKERTIEYLDSFAGPSKVFINHTKEWLAEELGPNWREEEWRVLETRSAIQHNGYDCGVFTITNAECVTGGIVTDSYDWTDMTAQRHRIAAVLLNRGFGGEFVPAEDL